MYDFLNPHEQKEYACVVCGKPTDAEEPCSNDCFKASLI
jgi:predicted nucleic acid-binding Zn ribbon protein